MPRFTISRLTSSLGYVAVLLSAISVFAQAQNSSEVIPAPIHDLSGVWMAPGNIAPQFAPASIREFYLFTFTKEGPEMTPWALERFKQAKASNSGEYTLSTTNDPVLTKCDPPGVPRVYFHPYPFEFVHTRKYTLILYEYDHTVRRVYTDGRPLPEDPDPSWMGYSVGRWEGDTTLVVETTGFNDKTWLDRMGHPHSTKLHVTERFRRVDKNHLEIDFVMEDPIALVKPWKSTFYYDLKPSWEIGEISCSGDYLDFAKFEK